MHVLCSIVRTSTKLWEDGSERTSPLHNDPAAPADTAVRQCMVVFDLALCCGLQAIDGFPLEKGPGQGDVSYLNAGVFCACGRVSSGCRDKGTTGGGAIWRDGYHFYSFSLNVVQWLDTYPKSSRNNYATANRESEIKNPQSSARR